MFRKLVLFLALVIGAVTAVPVVQQQDVTTLQAESRPLSTSYQFGYNDGQSVRSETRDLTGNVVGSFSYIGPDGVVRTTHYTAGQDGYKVVPAPPVTQAVDQTAPVVPYSVGSSQPAAATTATTATQNVYPYSVFSRFYGNAATPTGYVAYQTPTAQTVTYQAPSNPSTTTYAVAPASQYTTAQQAQSSAVRVVPATQTTAYQTVPTGSYYGGYQTAVPATQYPGYQSVPVTQYAAYQVAPATTYSGYQMYPAVRVV